MTCYPDKTLATSQDSPTASAPFHAMTIERVFLGWDEPVVTKVRRHLLGDGPPDPAALGGLLMLVPTQQSGRRLRQALTAYAAQYDVHLGYLRPQLPIDLVRGADGVTPVATPIECSAAWARLLLDTDYTGLAALFPARDTEHSFGWALATGRLIQNLRHQLAAAGLTIRKVSAEHLDALEEPDRWADIARLELRYLDLLKAVDRCDPAESRIEQSFSPRVPQGTERVILACAPDPDAVALQALERLSTDVPVQVLIHAPASMADSFDEWGRPVASRWQAATIAIPDAEHNILLAGTPAEQGRLLVRTLLADNYSPVDIGVGVPDPDVVPFLLAELRRQGIEPFDPNGVPVAQHPLFTLVDAYRGLLDNGRYDSLASFLRHPDVLDFLAAGVALSPRALLSDLDMFQNAHLPADLTDVRSRLKNAPGFDTVAAALKHIDTAVRSSADGTPASDMRAFLQSMFAHRTLSADEPADADFGTVAQLVADVLTEYEESCVPSFALDEAHVRTLLVEHLRALRYEVPRMGAEIDLEGWLELHWNDAPCLAITGMNEGRVPESLTADPFLPNALRVQLGLRCDDDRLARDVYMMQAMVESRRANGRTCLIAGKTGSSGDPLRPSRLLFTCGDAELPARARRVFGAPEGSLISYPASTSFLLRPSPPGDIPAARVNLSRLAVTGFKDYLACPFRFYLKRVLRMEALDDLKQEMDTLDFGSLMHEVLSRMAQNSDACNSSDAALLTRFLHTQADGWMTMHFGTSLPLNLQMQLNAARERLSAVARVHAARVAEGWETILVEHPVEATIGGLTVHGQIDRVDRHRDTGDICILDYKTSDNGHEPDKEHLRNPSDSTRDYARTTVAGKARAWKDLQLPLYIHMLAEGNAEWADAIPGYFNIPASTEETAVREWRTFTPELLTSAVTCATGVAEDIIARRYWPPASRVDNDDFESLFTVNLESSVDYDSFLEYMEGTA